MEDGVAGAAFVIPESHNLTHSYSLPEVSIFTAELLAISMALQHISAIPVTKGAIVICSDSKSDSRNAREDLVREIVTTTHQLTTRGTEVRFHWVGTSARLPQRQQKRGAKWVDSSTVTMKIGLADVNAELTKQAWKQWEDLQEWNLLPRCADLLSSHHAPPAPCMCIPQKCECGMTVSCHPVQLHLMLRPLQVLDWETTVPTL